MKKTALAEPSTEERIRQAAREVFTRKGYAATRTRDIAEKAGINLALLNYYFRSKEKLFHLIMMETVQHFAATIKDLLNDPDTGVEKKLELIISRYIDMLSREPNFPFFILSEIHNHPAKLLKEAGIREAFTRSVFFRQLADHLKERKIKINPVHFLINFAGLTVFPFIGKPMILAIGRTPEKEFMMLMEERKKLIPRWIKSMMLMSY